MPTEKYAELAVDAGTGWGCSWISKTQFDAWANRPEKTYIICQATRPGVNLFATQLEHTYYPPLTDATKFFELCILEWQDIFWTIIAIPIGDLHFAHKIAEKTYMRIAEGCLPVLIGNGQINRFPNIINGSTLENCENSPVYDGFKSQMELMDAEQKEVDKFLREINEGRIKTN